MTKNIRFIKEETGNWYADVLDQVAFLGVTKDNCLMVAGAPEFLDRLSQGKNHVTVQVSTKEFEEKDGWLTRTDDNIIPWQGADYIDSETSDSLWLCFVNFLLWNFRHPKTIYYKTIKE